MHGGRDRTFSGKVTQGPAVFYLSFSGCSQGRHMREEGPEIGQTIRRPRGRPRWETGVQLDGGRRDGGETLDSGNNQGENARTWKTCLWETVSGGVEGAQDIQSWVSALGAWVDTSYTHTGSGTGSDGKGGESDFEGGEHEVTKARQPETRGETGWEMNVWESPDESRSWNLERGWNLAESWAENGIQENSDN